MQAIVISIDAMITSDLEILRHDERLDGLLDGASVVKEMMPTFPALTYPCHVSIMTGCTPKRHGIIHNEEFRPLEPVPTWNGNYGSIGCDSMLTVARRNGISTALVSWPVSIDAPADYLLPEIWPEKPYEEEIRFYRTHSTGIAGILERHLESASCFHGEALDVFSTDIAVDILKEKDPDLLFIHYAGLDCSRHNMGSDTNKNLPALRFIAGEIARLYQARRDEDTTLVILGDHGQKDCGRVFHVNEALRRLGAIDVEMRTWRIYAHTSALSAYVYLNGMAKSDAFDILKYLQEVDKDAIEEIFPGEYIRNKYAIPGSFAFVLKAAEGTYLSSAFSQYLFEKTEKGKYNIASHGNFPEDGPKPPFAICGKRANGTILEKASIIDEAATIMRLFDIEMAPSEGICLEEMLEGRFLP